MDTTTLREGIETSLTDDRLRRIGHPRLLFGASDSMIIKERARGRSGFLENLMKRADHHLEIRANELGSSLAREYSAALPDVSLAYFLTGTTRYREWVFGRIRALLGLDTWMAPVHVKSCRYCDHVMTNVAAQIAEAFDLIATDLNESETQEIADGVYQMHMSLYLDATEDRKEWWSKKECESNWKIMSHGDSGYTACCFAEYWPESKEAILRAANGVVEILDMVPPEGDWPEGINYWFGTLRLGLRFAHALHRISDGRVDLLSHPALQVTGDYAAALLTPGGNVYNFGDNGSTIGDATADALYLLAVAADRADWLHIARSSGGNTAVSLWADDPEIIGKASALRGSKFPRSGVVTCRSGQTLSDSFLGFRCGPSDVGHSHLDAASFVFEFEGTPLVWGEATWPYAHFLGFFDTAEHRWNWDNLATIGHNTILVDGRGQTFGSEYAGRILDLVTDDGWDLVAGDASVCYPGLLTKFVRSILFIHPDTLVIRDIVTCTAERHVMWLMHPAGSIDDRGEHSVVRNNGRTLWVSPLLPDQSFGFRVSDISRKSIYEDSNSRKMVFPSIRYRAFEPLRAAESFEFLMLMRAHADEGEPERRYRFESNQTAISGGWRICFSDATIEPDGDSMRLSRSH
jgi:hypothetical protein